MADAADEQDTENARALVTSVFVLQYRIAARVRKVSNALAAAQSGNFQHILVRP